jgi:ABC-type glycerol-3-phosphate transport system substrate-binding protein
MQRRTALTAMLAATAATLTGCATSGGGSSSDDTDANGTVHLKFQSLAFADTTVAQTKKAVQAWNAQHPKVQIKLIQGSWDNVHDQLVTQLAGGTAPDIIHDETSDIIGFAQQDYFADLKPYLSSSLRGNVSDGVWGSLTVGGKVIAVPTLQQTYVVFANTTAFGKAGVPVPSGKSLSWDEFRSMAKKLTGKGSHGLGWGLKQPAATVLNMSANFDAKWFRTSGGTTEITVGTAEMQVPQRIHAMAYEDKSIDLTSLTQSGGDVLPGFYAGKYAMMVAGSYVAQQIQEQAPKGFRWAVLPPLAGTSTAQPAGSQTLSVSKATKHVKEAAQFIDYFVADANLAKLAQSDWLIPATASARTAVREQTGGKDGWGQILVSGENSVDAPFLHAKDYPQWKDQIATPALQRYLANDISASKLASQLTQGWKQVAGGGH